MHWASSRTDWRIESASLRDSRLEILVLLRMRSSAQLRFTAVGRAAFSVLDAACKSSSSSRLEDAADSYPASASPNAAAAPIAGAPRTTISLIACATDL